VQDTAAVQPPDTTAAFSLAIPAADIPARTGSQHPGPSGPGSALPAREKTNRIRAPRRGRALCPRAGGSATGVAGHPAAAERLAGAAGRPGRGDRGRAAAPPGDQGDLVGDPKLGGRVRDAARPGPAHRVGTPRPGGLAGPRPVRTGRRADAPGSGLRGDPGRSPRRSWPWPR
jgi:hypothetical protein